MPSKKNIVGSADLGAKDRKISISRRFRSKENTRRKLIDAALLVISEKGVDGTAIADITEKADVGFGSFYNYFSSKKELVSVVFAQRAADLSKVIDIIIANEPDMAVAVAYIHKVFLTKAFDDSVWGWFIVKVQLGLPELIAVFDEKSNAVLKAGVKQGRFSVDSPPITTLLLLAGLMAVTRAMLQGDVKPSAANQAIECLLRMIGVAPDEARLLSRRRLPAYIIESMEEMRQNQSAHPSFGT